MRILVTGSSGRFGAAIVAYLSRWHEVLGLDRFNNRGNWELGKLREAFPIPDSRLPIPDSRFPSYCDTQANPTAPGPICAPMTGVMLTDMISSRGSRCCTCWRRASAFCGALECKRATFSSGAASESRLMSRCVARLLVRTRSEEASP